MLKGFKSESVHKVDAKGRVSIPAQFRRVLEENDPEWTEGLTANFAIIHGRSEHRRLECLTMRAMAEIDAIVDSYDPFSDEREELEFFLSNHAAYASLDDSGRIVLSPKLREVIGLRDEAVFSGMGQRFHIWEPQAYAVYAAEMEERKRVAGGVSGLLKKSRLLQGGGA